MAILGAIIGDIAGSPYEFHNIKYQLKKEELITEKSKFTDDTIMTIAIADALLACNLKGIDSDEVIKSTIVKYMKSYGNEYPHVGYGRNFKTWLKSDSLEPYNSYGNGSAMRCSCCGWIAKDLEQANRLGRLSAEVTHNHPEGIKGAVVISECIYLLKNGATKQEIFNHVSKYYNLNFTLDQIRPYYIFDVSCQGSVPQAIKAFLESNDFYDAISKAISIGGDSDTIAAITGSLAEAHYSIPNNFKFELYLGNSLFKKVMNLELSICLEGIKC